MKKNFEFLNGAGQKSGVAPSGERYGPGKGYSVIPGGKSLKRGAIDLARAGDRKVPRLLDAEGLAVLKAPRRLKPAPPRTGVRRSSFLLGV